MPHETFFAYCRAALLTDCQRSLQLLENLKVINLKVLVMKKLYNICNLLIKPIVKYTKESKNSKSLPIGSLG